MPRQKPAAKLEALRRQQAELAARLKEAEAADRETRKEQEQRRREIAGRVALAYAEANPDSPFTQTLAEQLHLSVTKYSERVLFPALTLAFAGQDIAPNEPTERAPRKKREAVAPAAAATDAPVEPAPAGDGQAA